MLCIVSGVFLSGTSTASAFCGTQDWQPTFGENPGVDDEIHALAVFDDGSGPALYAGGEFDTAGGVAARHIAKWDGSAWSALPGGGTNDSVAALAVFDDGSGAGPALYAGGVFTEAGGSPANRIAKWDGSSWSPLGIGTNTVFALSVFDDGSGLALYAGGPGGIAKWDGSTWSGISGGNVRALAVYDDGSGAALYVGGVFFTGGVLVDDIGKWDGTLWSLEGSGLNSFVSALAVFDDGTGPALFAGGGFTAVGGVSADRIAKWNGASWAPLGVGVGMFGSVDALAVVDDGSPGGSALFAGGSFFLAGGIPTPGIGKWDGSSWFGLGNGLSSGDVHALVEYDDGNGSALFAGGGFLASGGVAAVRNIGRWDGSAWSTLGSGLSQPIRAAAVFDDGSGPALYAGGNGGVAGTFPVGGIGRWDGSSWSPLGPGLGHVWALAVHDDGSGPDLYAGGTLAVGTPGGTAYNIASWDGTSWSALGGGTNDRVNAIAEFDDGSGLALYAGGLFTFAGGGPANRIAKWDGASWTPLGSGLNSGVSALLAYDDGSGAGPALYVGGSFSAAGGVTAFGFAKWDGTSWSAVSGAPTQHVRALTLFDDGSGAPPALYAGMQFGGGVLRWDGNVWSALGAGVNNTVYALTGFDDGTGPALYVGGIFTMAGGMNASSIARWDGSSWSSLDSEMNAHVFALAAHDDGTGAGSALYAGGLFTTSASHDSYLAKWGHDCSGACGGTYCSSLPNATGLPALLSASGHPGSSLVLTSSPVPNTPGLFFFGPMMLTGGTSLGDGLRCVGGTTTRTFPFVQAGMMMQPANAAVFAVNYAAPYATGLSGTKYFQHWFRSGLATGTGSNSSNGIEVTF